MMNNKEYIPEPIDTSDVVLSDEVLSLCELLSENTHDVWAKNRMSEGWKYGEKRDDDKKTTPCLVPYEMLSEEEKKYDRDTSYETLKTIIKLGFRIVRE